MPPIYILYPLLPVMYIFFKEHIKDHILQFKVNEGKWSMGHCN